MSDPEMSVFGDNSLGVEGYTGPKVAEIATQQLTRIIVGMYGWKQLPVGETVDVVAPLGLALVVTYVSLDSLVSLYRLHLIAPSDLKG